MFQNLTPVVKSLLTINALAYVCLHFLQVPESIQLYFVLFKTNVLIHRPYEGYFLPAQVVTYFFNHGSFFHILFNMLALASIGTAIEHIFDSQKFLKFYLFCGIVGGIIVAVLDPSSSPVVGASGAIFGVLVAYAYYFPQQKLMVFPFPPVASRTLVLIISALSVALVLAQVAGNDVGGNISHFGHLAGVAAALIYFAIERYIPFLQK